MRRRVIATLVVGLVALGVGSFGVLAADASALGSFSAVVNPVDALPSGGTLYDPKCPAAGSCVAVGETGAGNPAVLTGDPAAWGTPHVQAISPADTAGDSLTSLDCTAPTFCVATGSDGGGRPLVLTGDPATWGSGEPRAITLGVAFGNAGYLLSVSCTSSTFCVAVGKDGHRQPFVLAGDPATWGAAQAREITLGDTFGPPDGAGSWFTSVACTSPTACVAVGRDGNQQPIELVGDPATWSPAQAQEISLVDTSLGGGSLGSVTCPAAGACVAVGADTNGQPLVLAGDPSTWGAAQAQELTLGSSFDTAGRGSTFTRVTCSSSSACAVVGQDGNLEPITLAGDPSAWKASQVKEIALGSSFGSAAVGSTLNSVACTSPTACVAVGEDANDNPLQLAGDPATWTSAQAEEIPFSGIPLGAQGSPVALSCASDTACVDLGSYANASGDPQGMYLLQGDPATWDQANGTLLPNLQGLKSLSCVSSSHCVAVGGSDGQLLVLAGNPATWSSAQPKSIALGAALGGAGTLVSVACTSSTFCVAVGRSAKSQPIAVAGNPSSWGAAAVKQFTLKKTTTRLAGGAFGSVECVSQTLCVAVGYEGPAAKSQLLTLAGDPTTWAAAKSKQITLGKSFGSWGALSSVACPSSTDCVAVGHSATKAKPLVLAGNPASWNAKSAFTMLVPAATSSTVTGFTPNSGASTGYLASVSCLSATHCLAVGGDGDTAPLSVTGNPAQWPGQSLARPAQSGSSFDTALAVDTSCGALSCFAGGLANGGDFVALVK